MLFGNIGFRLTKLWKFEKRILWKETNGQTVCLYNHCQYVHIVQLYLYWQTPRPDCLQSVAILAIIAIIIIIIIVITSSPSPPSPSPSPSSSSPSPSSPPSSPSSPSLPSPPLSPPSPPPGEQHGPDSASPNDPLPFGSQCPGFEKMLFCYCVHTKAGCFKTSVMLSEGHPSNRY